MGGVKPILKLASLQPNPAYNGNWAPNAVNPPHHWLIKSVTDANGLSYLGKLVIQDLELDGNFAEQRAWSSEANATGYKSFAIDVAARTGWIKNVTVRNFGSVGNVPQSALFSPAGVEAFVIRVATFAENQASLGAAPNNFPWIIEDVELTDFHSVHGGYGAMIMPVVYQANLGSLSDTAVAVVRRCQLRLNERAIAFGTAGRPANNPLIVNGPSLNQVVSGRIRFIDNVVLNAGLGFNTDSHTIGPMFFENNAFLDIGNWGQLGQPNSGINHSGYLLKDNLVRLRGRLNLKFWTDICFDDFPNFETDPNLGLGRYETHEPHQHRSVGLVVVGAAGDVRLERNDFTAWPNDNFYLPNPGATGFAKLRLVWKVPGGQNVDCRFYDQNRPPVAPMVFDTTRVSTQAYDFKYNASSTLAYGNITQLQHDSPETAAVQHLQERNAVAPGTFKPKGTLRRVLPDLIGSSPPRLYSVKEVQIGEVFHSGTDGAQVKVNVRAVKHVLRASGASPVETSGLNSQSIKLRYEWRDQSWTPSGLQYPTPLTTDTDNTGSVTFTLNNFSSTSGVLRLTAWIDGETPASGTFEPDRDAWATYDYPLNGASAMPVVELNASPDVGDDKNLSAAKRARIRVTRTGSTVGDLTVNLTLHNGVVSRPADNVDLAATYGTSGSADYNVINGSVGTWSTTSPYTTATLTIPNGQSAADAQVNTRADNLTEQNLIVCRLAPNGTLYAPGVSTEARILIYDGPLWTVTELSANYGSYYGISSEAYAINDATGSTQPRAAGYGSYGTLNGSEITYVGATGASWPLPGLVFGPLENVIYRGISKDPVHLVGALGGVARVTRLTDTDFPLDHLYSGPSMARGITPDRYVVVGESKNDSSVTRPVSWTWTGSGTDYSKFNLGGALNAAHPGIAFGVNASKQVVGEMYVQHTGAGASSGSYAFRTAAGTTVDTIQFTPSTGVGSILRAPGTSGNANRTGRAAGINAAGESVGWYMIPTLNHRKATHWSSASPASSAAVTDLGAWAAKAGTATDTHSAAQAVNSSGWIVGWSGNSSSLGERAVLRWAATSKPTDWIDLNDPHYSSGLTGWDLKDATAINSSGHIVGNGTYGNNPRAFVLIPRTTGN